MAVNKYIVTIEYITPSGKRSVYTDTVWHYTPFAASDLAKDWLYIHPRRKVAQITSTSVSR